MAYFQVGQKSMESDARNLSRVNATRRLIQNNMPQPQLVPFHSVYLNQNIPVLQNPSVGLKQNNANIFLQRSNQNTNAISNQNVVTR